MKTCNFEDAFAWTMKWEGRVLENDPRDPGGMTCWGISRNFNPDADFWPMVDDVLKVKNNDFAQATQFILYSPQITASIKTWYYVNVYLKNSLDSLEWQLGMQVFDASVNLGHRAIDAIQALLDLKPDGEIGPITLAEIEKSDAMILTAQLLFWRATHYIQTAKPEYVNGLLQRCLWIPHDFAAPPKG